ncbi:MAG: pyridoxal-phosphate dependent enzyme [Gemmatimonadota bacterium]
MAADLAPRPVPRDRPLFRAYPWAADRLPWTPLAALPTPVEALDSSGAWDADIWIKRDDLTGAAYGGNKVRKLEFLLQHAREYGATRLITAGAFGSHHALATAVYGRQLGFDVTLVLFPQHRTDHVRAVMAAQEATGAEIRVTSRMELVPVATLSAQMAHRGQPSAVIPPGGSNPTGTLAYVNAALELADQIHAREAPEPQSIHVATGTMGTMAGIAIGAEMAGLAARVIGWRITSRIVTNEWAYRRLVVRTLRRMARAGIDVPEAEPVLERSVIRDDQLGGGYGRATEAGDRATAAFAEAGITLDPTYSAKAAAGMLEIASSTGGPTLFWHTLSGSMPA